MKRIIFVLFLAVIPIAVAGSSLTLGAVLPGYDKIRSGSFERSATNLIRGVSVELGHVCGIVETFIHDRRTNVSTAYTLLDPYISYGDTMREVTRTPETIVFMVHKGLGGDVLGLLTELDGGGIALVVC